MAKRVATLAAFLAVLLVGATAHTTVTTVEIDEDENQGRWSHQGGECRQQIQQQAQQLRHCHEFLREQARGGGDYDHSGRFEGREREEFGSRSEYGQGRESRYGRRTESQYEQGQFDQSRRGGRGSQQLDLCCNELRQLDNQCRCEGLRQIVRREQQQRQQHQQGRFRGQGQEVEEIARVARNLPQQCGVGPQYCEIRTLFV